MEMLESHQPEVYPFLREAYQAYPPAFRRESSELDNERMMAIYTTTIDELLKTRHPDVYALRLWGVYHQASANDITVHVWC